MSKTCCKAQAQAQHVSDSLVLETSTPCALALPRQARTKDLQGRQLQLQLFAVGLEDKLSQATLKIAKLEYASKDFELRLGSTSECERWGMR